MTGSEAVRGTGGQALVAQLIEEGVVHIFGIPGVQLDWGVEALRQRADEIEFIVPRHEQATSYMADGYARTTGREGVCMMVPGPGMLNALSGLATAWACNSPVLFIAGQIPSSLIGRGFGMLHEIPDQSGILKSLTKWHACASSPEEIPSIVNEAFRQLRSGRPRPVAIEVPPDILQAQGEWRLLSRAESSPQAPSDEDAIAKATALLRDAKLPVIYVGGGCRAAGASEVLRQLAEALQAPVVMTEGGRGALPDGHALALTTLGGRVVMPRADVIVVAGSRFVNALAHPVAVPAGARIIYLNIEASDMAAPRPEGIVVTGDLRLSMDALLLGLGAIERPARASFVARARAWAAVQLAAITPQYDFVTSLRTAMAPDDVLVSELTQVGYYSNIAFPVERAGGLVTPGYQGTLGYGFPTSLGVAIGNSGTRTVSINGDGGFGWGLQELATLARYAPDLTVIVFADGHFGNVRRIQKRTFGHTFVVELTNPDYQMLAAAHGIPAEQVSKPAELKAAMDRARERRGPAFIEVRVDEMPTPWALIHPFVTPSSPAPVDPFEETLT